MGSMAKVMQKIRGVGGSSDELPSANSDAPPVGEELVEESTCAVDAAQEALPEETVSYAEAESTFTVSPSSDGAVECTDAPEAADDDTCLDDSIADMGGRHPS